ncbi:recombinase family protein [Bacteroidales bacterium OttesenSCG-928-I21]|nr:recombinase family protein [Bacteroidales bacterium OttesenSCG-928-I21]
MTKYVAYIRVSTEKQGRSGLGLDAQKTIIRNYVKEEDIVAWFEEHKSGKNLEVLPELEKAKRLVKENENYILVIAKADRFRNTQQALDIIDELTHKKVFFCNVGQGADKFMLTILFAFAEKERTEISIRTKAALAELKKKGIKLGRHTHKKNKKKISRERIQKWSKAGCEAMREKALNNENNKTAFTISIQLRAKGLTYKKIAGELNKRGLKTPKSCEWTQSSVFKNMKRFERYYNL